MGLAFISDFICRRSLKSDQFLIYTLCIPHPLVASPHFAIGIKRVFFIVVQFYIYCVQSLVIRKDSLIRPLSRILCSSS